MESRTPEVYLLSQAVNVTEGLDELMTGGDENACMKMQHLVPKFLHF